MASLSPDVADQVAEACRSNADETAEAFSRALDAQIAVSVGRPGTLDRGDLPGELDGPGLVVALLVGQTGALVALPESSGLLPDWYTDPDPTSESKLTTLAQELGMLVLPEDFMPEDFKVARSADLAKSLAGSEPAESLAAVPLELSATDRNGTARLIWPVSKAAAAVDRAEKQPPTAAQAAAQTPAKPEPERAPRMDDLPPYTRSLLRVKVPVVVTLADKRQSLSQIIELGPGSIIQFDKSCEETLQMDVGDHPMATGEAVKVGDKFGLRVTSIILPEERFKPVRPS